MPVYPIYRKWDRPHHWNCTYGWFWQESAQLIANSLWYRSPCRDWRSANFWRKQLNSNSQLRWGFNIYSFIRSNLRTSGRSLLWFTTKRLTFQELSSKRSLQLKHFTIECKQRPRNWQKTQRTGQLLKTPNLCSYWLPTVTRLQLRSDSLAFGGRWNSTSQVN